MFLLLQVVNGLHHWFLRPLTKWFMCKLSSISFPPRPHILMEKTKIRTETYVPGKVSHTGQSTANLQMVPWKSRVRKLQCTRQQIWKFELKLKKKKKKKFTITINIFYIQEVIRCYKMYMKLWKAKTSYNTWKWSHMLNELFQVKKKKKGPGCSTNLQLWQWM